MPGLIFGPPIHPVKDLKHINFSTDVFYGLFNGANETVPDTVFPSYVRVSSLSKVGLIVVGKRC